LRDAPRRDLGLENRGQVVQIHIAISVGVGRRRPGVVAVVTIADDLEAARWVVRAADLDPRVYAAVSES
jgi:hypothetical protein